MTRDLLQRLDPDYFSLNVFTGLPGSDFYDYVKEHRLHEFEDANGVLYLRGHDERVDEFYGGNPYRKVPYPRRVAGLRRRRHIRRALAWRLKRLQRRWSGPSS